MLSLAQKLAQEDKNVLSHALAAFFYIAFFLNVSVTISSLVLIDEFGDLHIRAAHSQTDSVIRVDETNETTLRLLTKYNGGRKLWKWVMWHCMSLNFQPVE